MHPVTIGNEEYKSKKDAKAACKKRFEKIINVYGKAKYAYIYRNNKEDFPFMMALYMLHSERKPIENIVCFKIDRIGGTFHTAVVFRGGQFDTFAWYSHCICNIKKTAQSMYSRALRQAVDDQIKEFASQGHLCAICEDFTCLQVDHHGEYEFKDLRDRFTAEHKINVDDLKFGKAYRRICFDESDEYSAEVCCVWQDFHRKYANMQMLCNTCHKKKSSETVRKNSKKRRSAAKKSPKSAGSASDSHSEGSSSAE